MAGSVNKVVLIGRLGDDPEVHSFLSGSTMCRLWIATAEQWTSRQTGETKERIEWHSVEVHWEAAVRFAETYLTKDRLIFVEGKLEARRLQGNSKHDCYTTTIAIRRFSGRLVALDRPPRRARELVKAKPLVQPAAEAEFSGNQSCQIRTTVGVGTKVTLEAHDTGKQSTYQIVNELMSDIELGLINRNTPLACALIGLSVNDVAVVQAPGGERSYTIIDIEQV